MTYSLKDLLFNTSFFSLNKEDKEPFSIVGVGDIVGNNVFIQILSGDFRTVACLHVEDDVLNNKDLKPTDIEVLFNEDKTLVCRLKTVGNRTLNNI